MKTKQCLVIGLGRFGTAVATTLYEMGHEVVAIDQSEENVERVMNLVTHAAIVDASDERACGPSARAISTWSSSPSAATCRPIFWRP